MTTSGIQKFYSNGLDYESAVKEGARFWGGSLYPLWRRLLTYVHFPYRAEAVSVYGSHATNLCSPLVWDRYPMPTLALLPGHAFAAGFMTAMMHDYRLMNPHRGFLCLNELDFGAPLKSPMASIFRQKVPSPNTFRTMILESKRYGALEGLKEGLVDGLGAMEEVVVFVREMGLLDRGKTGVYGRLKMEMWGETVSLLDDVEEGERRGEREMEDYSRRQEEEKRRVENWERRNSDGRSKL